MDRRGVRFGVVGHWALARAKWGRQVGFSGRMETLGQGWKEAGNGCDGRARSGGPAAGGTEGLAG